MRCSKILAIDVGLVGDPVDVVTGANIDSATDMQLPGAVPILWRRYYHSGRLADMTSLGSGHRHHYDRQLIYDLDGISYINERGDRIAFDVPEQDGLSIAIAGYVLQRVTERTFWLHEPGQPSMYFSFSDPSTPALLQRHGSKSHSLALQYDKAGRLRGILDPSGRTVEIATDTGNRITGLQIYVEKSGAHHLLQYRYDDRGNLIEGIDAYSNRFTFAYDAGNRLIRRTDRRGYSFEYTYDQDGRCIHSRGEDGLYEVHLDYMPAERLTSVTRADGGQWLYFYDENGAITQVIDPYGGFATFVLDDEGRVAEEVDPNGNVSQWIYSPTGQILGKQSSLGHVTAKPENPDEPDPLEHRVPSCPAEWEYGDLVDLDSAEGQPGSLEDHLHYMDGEAPASLESLEGVTSTNGAYQTSDGRLYDKQGNLVRERGSWGTERRWVYNANGDVQRYTDRDGGRYSFEYGSWDLLVRIHDPLGNTVEYVHNPEEEIARVVDAGGTASEYRYDLKDRLVEVHSHGSLEERYSYDLSDNLVERTDGSGRTLLTQEIGAGNLVMKEEFATGKTYSFEYDDQGRFTAITGDGHTLTFEYDELGHYAADERDGLGVRHLFLGDDLVETTTLGTFVTQYSVEEDRSLTIRDPSGARHRIKVNDGIVEKVLSSGVRETTRFDADGRCLQKTVEHAGDQGQRWQRDFTYSGEGDLRSVRDSVRGETHYQYDAAHRLSGVVGPEGTRETYRHDSAGNLLEKPGLRNVQLRDGNRLASANGSRFEYNHRHAISVREDSARSTRYTYDDDDQLIQIQLGDVDWEAEYDALGRRISKRYQSRQTTYYWDTDRLAAEIRPDGSLRLYVYADSFALVAFLFIDYESLNADPASGKRYFVFYDHLGAPLQVEDEGATVWSARIDPDGTAHIRDGAKIEFALRFPGQYADNETGLHYNRFRYYCPEVGRYLEPDPEGIAGGINLYTYSAYPLIELHVRGDKKGDCPKKKGEQSETKRGKPRKKSPRKAPRSKAPKKAKKLTHDELQGATDKIHDAAYKKGAKNKDQTTTTVTQGRDKDGNVVHTVTHSYGTMPRRAQAKAKKLLGPNTQFPKSPRGKQLKGRNHGEQKGIAATNGQTGRQQASSSGTPQSRKNGHHGGAACKDCHTAQQKAGVKNVTGSQPPNGTGRVR